MSVYQTEFEYEGPLGQEAEEEFAQRLLEVSGEDELEEFLGSLVKSVARGVGSVIKSPIGQALGKPGTFPSGPAGVTTMSSS